MQTEEQRYNNATICFVADDCLASLSGPLEYVYNSIKALRDQSIKINRDLNELKIFTLTFPQIMNSSNSGDASDGSSISQRFSFTGTVDDIGKDIQRIKQIGVYHIIFAFSPDIKGDLRKVIDTSKELSKFAK
jgi:hypothetical protein